jgi:hypothetical protein
MSNVQVTVYTDPGCPFGFNAQRQDLQLLWHYGDAIDVNRRMIVLLEETVTYEERGLPIGVIADAMARLLDEYGMPMLATPAPRMSATIDGCRAFLGEFNDPDHAVGLCGAAHTGVLAATRSMSPRHPRRRPWSLSSPRRSTHGSPTTTSQPRLPRIWRRRARARGAGPRARLAGPAGRSAFTASAIDERDGHAVAAAGFQPFAVHEVAMANVAPDVELARASIPSAILPGRRPAATAEIAAIRDVPIDKARAELEESGASFSPAAGDGYCRGGVAIVDS